MYKMNDGWTNERMDDFRDEVNRRFDGVDKRFDKFEGEVNRRFGEVDKRFDKVDREFGCINDRLDSLHKILIYAALTVGSATVAGWASMIALLITRT
jgi:tetrahydromethanopterin S-methyltransferase subunit G